MSPVETILLSGLSILSGVIAFLYKAQEAARKKAHAETRDRIAKMNVHIDDCNRERSEFRERIGRLEERLKLCPKEDCPLKMRTI